MRVFSPDEAIDIATRLETKAVCQLNERIKAKLLAKARAVAESALAQNQNHSNLHHVLGLCWYAEIEWTIEAKEQIEQHFSAAVKLDATNQFATLFLGHFYFDEARYDKALNLFLEIDDVYFEKLDQKYRVLKNHELIVCCRLYLNADDVTFEEIDNLCKEYESTEPSDVPVPQEIVACLAKLVPESKNLKQAAERVILMLKRTGFERAKSLAEALETINACLVA
jgi:tetratricopeptide (TPR) repeat protein